MRTMSEGLDEPSCVYLTKTDEFESNFGCDLFKWEDEGQSLTCNTLKPCIFNLETTLLAPAETKFHELVSHKEPELSSFPSQDSFILPHFSNDDIVLPELKAIYYQEAEKKKEKSLNEASTSVNTENTEVKSDNANNYFSSGAPEKDIKKKRYCAVKSDCDNITYGCTKCGKSFKHHSYLQKHKKIHEEIKPFLCQFCGHLFRLKHQLKAHLPIHTNDLPFQCYFCDKKFRSTGNLSDHKKRCVNAPESLTPVKIKCRPYICDCGKSFETARLLDAHENDYHNSHRCCLCGSLFMNKPSLTRHMNSFHSKMSKANDDNNSLIECSYCKKLITKVAYKQHVALHSGEKRKFTCDLCGRTFSAKYNAQAHRLTHLSSHQRPFKCEKCGKGFIRKSSLNEHMTQHSGQRHYCDICGQPFKRRDNLQRHMKEHEREKEFHCTYPNCDKRFMRKSYLEDHLKRHRGEKHFCCPICYKESVTKSGLNAHMKLVHKTTRDVFGALD